MRTLLLSALFCTLAEPAFAQLCGNDVIDPGEECDDGNGYVDDGCSKTCALERNATVHIIAAGEPAHAWVYCSFCAQFEEHYECPANTECTFDVAVSPTRLTEVEVFQDRPGATFDSESTCGPWPCSCWAEPEYLSCHADSNNLIQPLTFDLYWVYEPCLHLGGEECDCGNGVQDGPEVCDDGNFADGDGCSSSCTIERGYMCSGFPSYCKL